MQFRLQIRSERLHFGNKLNIKEKKKEKNKMRIIVLLALGLLTFSFICYAHADNIPVQREFPADPADLESDDLEEDLEGILQ